MTDRSKQIAAALARVPALDFQGLKTLRTNAEKFGPEAGVVVQAIDERLATFEAEGGMAAHRLEFARGMLRLVERHGGAKWIPAREMFNQARVVYADNPFVSWMSENSARQIPVTKALDDVLPEFPHVERRKDNDGRSARVWFRLKR